MIELEIVAELDREVVEGPHSEASQGVLPPYGALGGGGASNG